MIWISKSREEFFSAELYVAVAWYLRDDVHFRLFCKRVFCIVCLAFSWRAVIRMPRHAVAGDPVEEQERLCAVLGQRSIDLGRGPLGPLDVDVSHFQCQEKGVGHRQGVYRPVPDARARVDYDIVDVIVPDQFLPQQYEPPELGL